MGPPPGTVTSLLNDLASGDSAAAAKLVPLVYDELRRLAARRLRYERPNHTLQATALVHEAYIKLVGQHDAKWKNRAQFFAVASQAMRRILVDYARAQQRTKRGGRQTRMLLETVSAPSRGASDEILGVDDCLARLEKLDAQQARIVELRYFAGLTFGEVSEVLGVSARTVAREWNAAKAWMYGELRSRITRE